MQRIASAASNNVELSNSQEAAFVRKIVAGKELLNNRLAHLPDEAVLIILNRAVLGYCQQTAQYFEFPWKVKEEVFAGLSDTVETFSSEPTGFNQREPNKLPSAFLQSIIAKCKSQFYSLFGSNK